MKRIISRYYKISELDYSSLFYWPHWIFALWWCKLFLCIPFFSSGSGESLGKCLLVFHNNYLWALMVSGFGSSLLSPTLSKSSEWFPVAKRIINPAYHLVSVCVVLANFLSLAKHDIVARNKALPQLELQLCLFVWKLYKI